MRYILICTIALLLFSTSLYSQEMDTAKASVKDTAKIWRKGGFFNTNFNQVSLTNWAQGGQNSLSLNSLLNVFANYKKNKTSWENLMILSYGFVKVNNDPVKKNEDKIDLNSKFGFQSNQTKIFYTALMNFTTQFSKGYNYPNSNDVNNKIYVSNFMAPGYLILSLGIDYKPNAFISIYLSPATGRFTFLNDDTLSKQGAYGVEIGEKLKSEFGAYFTGKFQKDVMKNVNLMSKLSLFNNYTNPDTEKRTNIVVNWEVLIGMKINKFLAASIYTDLIYDHDVKVPVEYTADKLTVLRTGPRTQFKETFGIGLSYKF